MPLEAYAAALQRHVEIVHGEWRDLARIRDEEGAQRWAAGGTAPAQPARAALPEAGDRRADAGRLVSSPPRGSARAVPLSALISMLPPPEPSLSISRLWQCWRL